MISFVVVVAQIIVILILGCASESEYFLNCEFATGAAYSIFCEIFDELWTAPAFDGALSFSLETADCDDYLSSREYHA